MAWFGCCSATCRYLRRYSCLTGNWSQQVSRIEGTAFYWTGHFFCKLQLESYCVMKTHCPPPPPHASLAWMVSMNNGYSGILDRVGAIRVIIYVRNLITRCWSRHRTSDSRREQPRQREFGLSTDRPWYEAMPQTRLRGEGCQANPCQFSTQHSYSHDVSPANW